MNDVYACPACRAGMDRYDNVAGCPNCGGVWLGNDAAQGIVQGTLSADVAEFLGRVRQNAAGGQGDDAYRAPSTSSRSCPVCSEALGATTYLGITLDVCTAHGTYFDRYEVQQLEAAQAERARQQRADDYAEAVAFSDEIRAARGDALPLDHGARALAAVISWVGSRLMRPKKPDDV